MIDSLLPVLIGGDLGAYSVALSFYEAYGVCSHVFFDRAGNAPPHAPFLRAHAVSSLTSRGRDALMRFADAHGDQVLLLVPCTEAAMAFVMNERGTLSARYRMLLQDPSVFAVVRDRAALLAELSHLGVPVVPHLCFSSVGEFARKQAATPVAYPAILLPTDRYASPTCRPVRVDTRADVLAAVSACFSTGYRGELMLRSVIGAQAPLLKTLVVIQDRACRVVAAVQARSVLRGEEGNACAALLAEPPDRAALALCRASERLGYCGVACFDLAYDGHGRAYVLDMHPCGGRHVDLLRAAGISLARLLVTQVQGGESPPCLQYPEVYWRCISDRTVVREGTSREVAEAMRRLAHGFAFCPFSYEWGTRGTPWHARASRLLRTVCHRRTRLSTDGMI